MSPKWHAGSCLRARAFAQGLHIRVQYCKLLAAAWQLPRSQQACTPQCRACTCQQMRCTQRAQLSSWALQSPWGSASPVHAAPRRQTPALAAALACMACCPGWNPAARFMGDSSARLVDPGLSRLPWPHPRVRQGLAAEPQQRSRHLVLPAAITCSC